MIEHANNATRDKWIALLRNLLLGSLVLLTAGCSATGTHSERAHNEWSHINTIVTYLPDDIGAQLGNIPPGGRLSLDSSPWGGPATITVRSRYFAASGRPCLEASVEAGSQAQPVNICQYGERRWGSTRAFPLPVTDNRSAGISQP